MILGCEPESSFKDIWKHKIRYDFPNKERAKKYVKIRDAFHWAMTIVYESQLKAMCDAGIPENVEEGNHTSHFHINRPMHEHSIAFLSNGIEKLVAEQNGNKNVVLWDIHAQRGPDMWRHLKWVVPIKVTGWKFIHCQVPFNDQEERYLTLHGNKKLYFTPGYSLQILKDETYVLSPKQQNAMKQLKEITEKVQMEQDNYWKTIVAYLKMELDVCKNEFKLKEN
ncbi:uncharacterized protein TNCV_3252931 [Trichonephila clavipes]|nr:uncharacterized protein TNCV_3252931 [Trichonephila clavipes]